ncbi:hypothetical protein IMG5_174210 [Ichthyophthirius multifiliis]|uniref:Uncharacterized protein n=1 Tax=Ichthyophthirius multifiliis TaxID=5932 RepID=G0R212_ICHMU|nr:hypothetical protein IMG5_174210 [Ichthyophthirius multifiliis]EGR28493.1 hypothetical protein IMG5_174210 [Ichthyophthirius multifiliis]|eukprot:XP_004029729.1 hypothetical protein IMG5_174210 [Ichthyophthirius multifiliis]
MGNAITFSSSFLDRPLYNSQLYENITILFDPRYGRMTLIQNKLSGFLYEYYNNNLKNEIYDRIRTSSKYSERRVFRSTPNFPLSQSYDRIN